MLNMSISKEQLQNIVLSGQYVVIVLVNKHRLHNDDTFYCGHYIVLYGFDRKSKKYFAKDPAADEDTTFIHDDALTAARKAFGTDEDIIFIPIYDQNHSL